MFKNLKNSGEWIWRIALTGLLVLHLWLEREFVGRGEYDKDKDKLALVLQKIQDNLSDNTVAIKLFESNRTVINDHELRIRNLEQRH